MLFWCLLTSYTYALYPDEQGTFLNSNNFMYAYSDISYTNSAFGF